MLFKRLEETEGSPEMVSLSKEMVGEAREEVSLAFGILQVAREA